MPAAAWPIRSEPMSEPVDPIITAPPFVLPKARSLLEPHRLFLMALFAIAVFCVI